MVQSARLVNSYQRVNPNAQRNQQKKDQKSKGEPADKVDLADEEAANELDDPVLEVVASAEDDPEEGHLDIAV